MTTQNYNSGNKLIAKNTLVIYGQLILKLFIGLYTSRLVLEALGVSDFGLYCVVGGVIGLFTVISNSLAGTTIRFINVERGKTNGDLNKVFNVCNVLHICMAIFLFILLEIGGVYYIYHYLNVDPGRESDAMFVFQVSTIMCCLGVINVPFYSLFNATEKFLYTSVVDISAKLARLFLLLWLLSYEGNRIRLYALIETVLNILPFIAYHYYSYRKWPEVVKWRFSNSFSVYKDVLLFSYYNLISTFAYSCRGQGSMLLINYFFGTVVNGAFGVAKTVERNIWPLANNIQSAAAPQITQSYSNGDMERVFYLSSHVSKYCLLMMSIIFFPLWVELDFILHIWLVKVPDGALVFCQIIMLMAFVSITDGGIGYVINASKYYSKFKMMYSYIMISCIPVGYVFFIADSPAYMILVVFLFADIVYRITQLYMMHRFLHFPILRFCVRTYIPVIITCMPILLCMYFTSRIQLYSPLWHICHIILIFLLTSLSAYYLGLRKHERVKILRYISIHMKK